MRRRLEQALVRARAVECFLEGRTQADIAREFGVSRGAVSKWKGAFDKHGPSALERRPVSGRPPRISREHLATLALHLMDKPEQHGYEGEFWTPPLVRDLVFRLYGVDLPYRAQLRLLHSCGLRPYKWKHWQANHYHRWVWLRGSIQQIAGRRFT